MLNQDQKSASHISAQPKNMEKNSVRLIMMYDIAGLGTNEIAEQMDMNISRVSIIKNSALYIEQRREKMREIEDKVVKRTAEKITENPAFAVLLDPEVQLACAQEKIKLATDNKNAFVRNSATTEILALGGIMPQKTADKGKTTLVIEEKLAMRLGFAKDYSSKEQVLERTVTLTNE